MKNGGVYTLPWGYNMETFLVMLKGTRDYLAEIAVEAENEDQAEDLVCQLVCRDPARIHWIDPEGHHCDLPVYDIEPIGLRVWEGPMDDREVLRAEDATG